MGFNIGEHNFTEDELIELVDFIKEKQKEAQREVQSHYKHKLLEERWAWIFGIMTSIIIILIAVKFESSSSVMNIISITSGLISITLAIVAIAIAFKQEIDSNNVNREMMVKLESLNKSIDEIENCIDSFKELNALKLDTMKSEILNGFPKEANINIAEVENVLDKKLKRYAIDTKKTKRTSFSKQDIQNLIAKSRNGNRRVVVEVTKAKS